MQIHPVCAHCVEDFGTAAEFENCCLPDLFDWAGDRQKRRCVADDRKIVLLQFV